MPMIRPEVFHSAADIQGAEEQWRFSLARWWDLSKPVLLWLMLNPSTANALYDDPTVQRVMHFSASHGYGSCWIFNMFPLRTPAPAVLWDALDKGLIPGHIIEKNLRIIRKYAAAHTGKVAAFGAEIGTRHIEHVHRAIESFSSGDELLCLGTNRAEWPLHPLARGLLHIPFDTRLRPWI